MRIIRGLANLVALTVCGGLGATLIVAGAGRISLRSIAPYLDRSPGSVFEIVVGVILILVALRFVIATTDERIRASMFARNADGGRVALTSYAVRELISGILREEIGLDRFRVSLRHRGAGVAITVRVALTASQRVTSISERIQSVLARQVPERTGVEVTDVSILVHSIRSSGRGRGRGSREEIIHAPDYDR
jgi:uncharacterized alkaline shock family protein YloU